MKRIFGIVLLLVLASPAWAQQSGTPIVRYFNLTSAKPIGPQTTPWISEKGSGISSHQIIWTTSGTVSSCSVKVQQSEDGVSWSDLIAGATCTSNSAGTLTTGIANYVRINATTFTGSGTLNVTYFGFPPSVPSTATIGGDVTSATAANFKAQVSAASGAFVSGSIADCAEVTIGCKADAKSTATDSTEVTIMQVLKQVSSSMQAIAGGTATASVTDPCSGLNKSSAPISITTATTTVIIAASASNKVYFCAINIGPIEAVADNIALVEDASGSCASPDAGIIGGTTAATGWNIAASGGLTYGSGAGTIAKTASTNVNVCLITSSAAEVPGVITYVLAP